MRALCGLGDEHLEEVARGLAVEVYCRGEDLTIVGEPEAAARAEQVFRRLLAATVRGQAVTRREVRYAVDLAREGRVESLEEFYDEVVLVTARGKPIRPKSVGQKQYVDAMRTHDLVFGIGPAGTGKTYLAMALAVAAFRNREVSRIILTRPAVEAGEKLGFLPGGLEEKVDPYLRPLYDALYDILGVEGFDRYMGRGMIEVAPLAYMRGRTLDDSFVILDEAQNTTPEQMKMFLTRLGFGSRCVVTGDITQVDLPPERESGLHEVREVLEGVEGIAFVYLTERDVVRHPLVQKIIRAYEEHERARGPRPSRGEEAPPAAPPEAPAEAGDG